MEEIKPIEQPIQPQPLFTEQNYIPIKEAEINQEASIRKDRFINEALRINQEFQQDWAIITNKLAALNKIKEEQDKLVKRG